MSCWKKSRKCPLCPNAVSEPLVTNNPPIQIKPFLKVKQSPEKDVVKKQEQPKKIIERFQPEFDKLVYLSLMIPVDLPESPQLAEQFLEI